MAKKKKTRNTEDKTSISYTFKFLFKWGLVAALWVSISVGILAAWYASELPDITRAMVFERRPTITIKANDGSVLERYGDIKGESVTVEDLPPYVVYAVLATEDRRFYSHFGIDLVGIGRAFFVNLAHGRFVQGGSTITQQLAKNLFLSRERTLKRKIQEAMLAVWIERKLTKDEILSAYLNRVYLGSGAYGIDAAARVYFNKSAKELTLREAATLAGLLKAPSRYSPASNPELAARRTDTVLQAMVDAGFIEKEQLESMKKLPPSPARKPSSGDTVRYFTDYIVSQLEDLVGPVEKDLIIETTLDPDIQKEAEQAITKALLAKGDQYHVGQGAAVVLRLDGAVMAMVGGRDYGMSEFNRATNALRPPGSSFKPVVYLAALENGWRINDVVVDEPITTGRYRPANYGHEYYGEVTLIEALTRSLNTVSVNLMRSIGPEAVINLAQRLGITADLEPDLSLALGSSGVPVIQMAALNASLARGGLAVDPFSIVSVKDEEGTVYYEHPKSRTARQVVARPLVYDLTTMMRSVVENGTGQAAQGPYIAAGKTGTSQDFRDAWFNGFTDRYAAAIWFGNDDNSPMKRVTGGSIAAPVWREIMTTAMGKNAPSYGTYAAVSEDFTFHDLLGRIIGGREDGGVSFFNFGRSSRENDNLQKKAPAAGDEYTPLGRHQWDLNE